MDNIAYNIGFLLGKLVRYWWITLPIIILIIYIIKKYKINIEK